MSWTVPVSSYQYMDYQNRVNSPKSDRYVIERTNPIMSHKTKDTFEQHVQDRLDYQAASMPRQKRNQTTKEAPFDGQTYSFLTGKGRYINTVC
ncbi:hypothetical protein CHH91_12675 [Virgibacillus sp. 7505]|uniref:hypothetical protein n=1 Tax=Virgibacillus sp. 7505 TaxID=2022548 RepID=UPI000BA79011|nr:hypothetical protein [Virgibacillus sp. 7505]PAE15808.1 hypothetical protein CHH91_12675 [Virgibacillus sp. 7505]